MPASEIVYLGPPGTFAHKIARKRYRAGGHKFISRETVRAVCEYVAANSRRVGVIPIDNSTSGTIYPSVDALLDEDLSLQIQEEISVQVELALLGRKGEHIDRIKLHRYRLSFRAKSRNLHLANTPRGPDSNGTVKRRYYA